MPEAIRSCFITAPTGANIANINTALVARGVQVIGLADIEAGSETRTALLNSIKDADLIVGVLSHERRDNVLFELGLAVGLGKQIIVFAPTKSDIVPSDLQSYQIVRTSLQNREAIDFAFDQLLAGLGAATRIFSPSEIDRKPTRVYPETDALRFALSQKQSERELESLVAHALRYFGAEIVVEAQRDRGFDLVVWSDDLQPYVGNPLPIEIKRRLRSREDAKRTLSQVAIAAKAVGANWTMLLYAEGPDPSDRVWLSQPSVLALRIGELFVRLRDESFANIVRSLRNIRVHGVTH